jgi:hypothetical protein
VSQYQLDSEMLASAVMTLDGGESEGKLAFLSAHAVTFGLDVFVGVPRRRRLNPVRLWLLLAACLYCRACDTSRRSKSGRGVAQFLWANMWLEYVA